MYPKMYDKDGQLLAVINNIVDATPKIKRVINGEFTFAFNAFEQELKSDYFDTDNTLVIEDQTFDIKYIEQAHDIDVAYFIECEHVNYRLEDGDENQYTSYAFTGTPESILGDILADTEFSVGVIDFTEEITVAVQSEISKKRLIYELANLIGGEIEYSNGGFTINIIDTIGQDNGFEIRFCKNLKGITKIIDKRGGLNTSYEVDIVELKNSNEYILEGLQDLEVIGIGDTVRIIDEVINLDIENRVVSIEYNPIFAVNTKLEIANHIELITDKINGIETTMMDLTGEAFTRIERTNQEIVSEAKRASDAEGALSTRVSQNAESIVSEAKRSSDAEGALSTRVSQNAESIVSEATRSTEAEGALSGRIDVLAGTVILTADANGNIASIRLDATGGSTEVKIKGDNINMEGLVTVNGNFKILDDGSVAATNGTFSGDIAGSKITGSTFISTSADGDTVTIEDGIINADIMFSNAFSVADTMNVGSTIFLYGGVGTIECINLDCSTINGYTPVTSDNIQNQGVAYADKAGAANSATYANSANSATYAGMATTATTAYGLTSGGQYGTVYVSENSNFRPVSSGGPSCGTSEGLWSSVWAMNGSIITSDERKKTDIMPLDERYLKFAKMIVPYAFKMVDGTSGRRHVGFIAQRIEEAMAECEISDMEFAGLIKAPVYAERLKDDEGNDIGEYDTTSEIIDYSYSLRYDEFIPLLFLWIRDISDKGGYV